MENLSFEKLRSVARFLKLSNVSFFQNWNLALFVRFIQDDPELSTIVEGLASRCVQFEEEIKNKKSNVHITQLTAWRQIVSFEQLVAFCWFYVKNIGVNKGSAVIDDFIINTHETNTVQESKKSQFFNDCIEPILIYIELQIKHALNSIRILQRYKILCEWYERKKLIVMQETEITKDHLSKYLFDNGFTYSLSETNVPSGRLDNIAIDLGLKNIKEISELPDVIVAESKIFDGTKRDILDAKNQVSKRISDLDLSEGFCVVFNKTDKKLKLTDCDGYVQGFSYINEGQKRIYILIINLNEIFLKSTSQITEVEVDTKTYAS